MHLVSPSHEHRETFEEALREMREAGEVGIRDWDDIGAPRTIDDYIRIRQDHADGRNLPEGWVPASTYWLIDRGQFIGEANIRHEVNDHLRTVGGQIGYWIRSSKRQQGYGRAILRFALEKAKELGLSRIVITCDETNAASRKIIESNGGVYESTRDMGPGNPPKLIFWIDVP